MLDGVPVGGPAPKKVRESTVWQPARDATSAGTRPRRSHCVTFIARPPFLTEVVRSSRGAGGSPAFLAGEPPAPREALAQSLNGIPAAEPAAARPAPASP